MAEVVEQAVVEGLVSGVAPMRLAQVAIASALTAATKYRIRLDSLVIKFSAPSVAQT